MRSIANNCDLKDLDGEIWKPVKGYEDLYLVSNMGRVKTLDKIFPNTLTGGTSLRKGRLIKPILQKSGYCHVGLWRNGKCKQSRLHRLVADAFCPNDDSLNKTQINHLNENKQDNRAENLAWCTAQENTLHGSCIEKRVANRKSTAQNRRRKVLMLNMLGKVIGSFKSIADASEFCGASRNDGHISAVCLGKQYSAYGYRWKYEE